jgi:NAD(P)-dependent dehydrogenase (short-subunit alcohol dehydrogenase family)
MPRTYVVTGSASGIGKATAELLKSRGDIALGVDLRDADVIVDLATNDGRRELVEAITRMGGGSIDGVVACAGLGTPSPAAVAVNYFGTVATFDGLNPLLRASPAPRAVGIASIAAIHPVDADLVEAMLAWDEPRALDRAAFLATEENTAGLIYGSTKRAFAIWVRHHAAGADWAGSTIPLNAIAPSIVLTPMTIPLLSNDKWRADIAVGVPMPLAGMMDPIVPAYLLAWLVSVENSHMCGQIIFVDSGAEVTLREDLRW